MSNANNPHGFRPLGFCLGGGPPVLQSFAKAVGYATAIFPFDLVQRAADGSIDTSITPGTTLISGVALDFGAASTATNHMVIISPDAMFEAQDNAGGAGILAVDLQLNANCIVSVAGNATSKLSGHQIADSTKATTSTLDLHLLQLLNVPENAFGPNARIEVVINKHRMNPGVAGV